MDELDKIIKKIEKLEIDFNKKMNSVPLNLSESMKMLWLEDKTKWHKIRFRNLYRKYEILMREYWKSITR